MNEKFIKNQLLLQEGLFDDKNKKSIPKFPWNVGVITSATGAAVRDILNIVKRRNPKVSVLVYLVLGLFLYSFHNPR